MGSCNSKKKISNEYIIDVQLMLRNLDVTNIEMLYQLDKLNDMVYGYDIYFNYAMDKNTFITTTNEMKEILNDFQTKNEFILKTLSTKPEEFWIYHNQYCQKKCDKMIEFDERKKELDRKMLEFKKNKTIIKQEIIDKDHIELCDDIDYFNRTMSLPSISKKSIKPLLTNILKYSKPYSLSANPASVVVSESK